MEFPVQPASPAAGTTAIFRPQFAFFARSVRINCGPNWVTLLDENIAYPPGVVNATHNLFTPSQIGSFSVQAPPAQAAPFGPQTLNQTSLTFSSEPVTESPGTVQQQQTVVPLNLVAPVTIQTALARSLVTVLSNNSGSTANVNIQWNADGAGGTTVALAFTLNTNNLAFLACGQGTVCNLNQTVPTTFPITASVFINTSVGFQVYGRLYY